MGKLYAGPWCDLTGRTGNNVGRYVKGQNIFSIRPHKSSKPSTVLQVNQQLRFAAAIGFLRRIPTLVESGFKAYDGKMSPMNAAVSYNLKNAISGIAPDFKIDYPKFLYSKGNLSLPPLTKAEALVAGEVKFTWTAPQGVTNALGTDKATFLMYNPVKNVFVVVKDLVPRSELSFALQIPPDPSGDNVHCYMSFASVDGKRVSDTIYAGSVTLL